MDKFISTVEKTHLKGDIVITDPCYLDDGMDHDETWYEFINNTKIPSLVQTSTLYGDWSCTMFDVTNPYKHKKIGRFCADAGLVCCCTLMDVLRFNPNFAKFVKEKKWCVTVIKNFEGDICFNKYETKYMYEGKLCKEHYLKVEGIGKKYRKEFKFCGVQTGL